MYTAGKYGFAALLAGAFFLTAFTTATQDDAVKKRFYETCMSDAAADFGTTVDKNEAVISFCKCAVEKTFEKYSAAEIAKMEAGSKNEMNKTLQPVIQPCIDELFKEN